MLSILPDCHRIDLIRDEAERGEPETIMVVPECASKRRQARLDSGPWQGRNVPRLFMVADKLVVSNEHASLDGAFMMRLFAFRTGAGAVSTRVQRPCAACARHAGGYGGDARAAATAPAP